MLLTMINIKNEITFDIYFLSDRIDVWKRGNQNHFLDVWKVVFSLPEASSWHHNWFWVIELFYSVAVLKSALLVLSTEQLKLHRITGLFRKSFRWTNNNCLFIYSFKTLSIRTNQKISVDFFFIWCLFEQHSKSELLMLIHKFTLIEFTENYPVKWMIKMFNYRMLKWN